MNMRKGKYLKHKKRKPVILIVCLVLLLVAAVGGTVAYLQATSDKVTNTFTPAEVEITPTEVVDHTTNTKKNIQFKNDSTVPVYIRATLVIYWTDTINGTEQTIAPPAANLVSVGSVKDGWFRVGDIYYCCAPVAPGDSTGVMLEPITVTLPDGSTAQCHIDVRSEAIQAEPESVVKAAWLDVDVDPDGKLAAG